MLSEHPPSPCSPIKIKDKRKRKRKERRHDRILPVNHPWKKIISQQYHLKGCFPSSYKKKISQWYDLKGCFTSSYKKKISRQYDLKGCFTSSYSVVHPQQTLYVNMQNMIIASVFNTFTAKRKTLDSNSRNNIKIPWFMGKNYGYLSIIGWTTYSVRYISHCSAYRENIRSKTWLHEVHEVIYIIFQDPSTQHLMFSFEIKTDRYENVTEEIMKFKAKVK